MRIILILLISTSLFAESRLSSFSLNYTDDQEDYQAYQFNVNWGVNENFNCAYQFLVLISPGEK